MTTKAQQTYERVEALVNEGAKRPDAFKQLAEEFDQSVDSVRGAYYTGRRQATGDTAKARGGRSKRRTETTPESAVTSAIATLNQAIQFIEDEVNVAETRAAEATREHEALKEAAGPKIEAIKAKIAALEGDPA